MKKEERYVFSELDRIESGAFGVVYKAMDQKLQKYVALKKMPIRSRVVNSQELLKQEIETLKQVPAPLGPEDDFNYLITYYDYFTTEDSHNLVMELFEDSKNFHDFLNSCGGRLSPGNALEIFSQICRGVKALHTLKIVHRDLKPANVLIQTDPIRIKVIDFGYAKLIRGGNDHFLSIAGSPVYMSPQNIMNTGYDGKANDIWSLGIILHQMVTGGFPWMAKDPKQLLAEINRYVTDPSILQLRDLDFDIKDIVIDCLQLQESDRINIEQLVWKVGSKLTRNQKQYDCNFRPLPQCGWAGIKVFRPQIQHLFMGIEELTMLAKRDQEKEQKQSLTQ